MKTVPPNSPPVDGGPEVRHRTAPELASKASDQPGSRSMLAEFLRRAEIIFFLSQSRMKSYSHDRVLGFLWWLFDPLFQMFIYVILMDFILKNGQARYPLFIACAVVPWRFLAHGSSAAGTSILVNAGLLKSINIDRIFMPISEIMNSLVNFLYALPAFGILMLLYWVPPTVHLLWLPAIVLIQLILVMGLGLILSMSNVFLRDAENLWQFLLQAWFFLTPTIYPSEQVPEKFRTLFKLNPAAGIVNGYRDVILHGRSPELKFLLFSAAASLGIFVLGLAIFRRSENEAMRRL
jgi:lipopolysaccharide transport system permease protein